MKIVWLAGLLVACGGPSTGELAELHRVAGTTKLAQVVALAPSVAKLPPVTVEAWQLPAGLKLDFSWDPWDPASSARSAYNAAIAHESQLAQPCASDWITWPKSVDLFFVSIANAENWLIEPACLLETGKGRRGREPVFDTLNSGLLQLESTKYVLVLRMRTLLRPGLVSAELEANKMESFEPGRIAGDAVLYEIATGAHLGGFAFDISNKSEVEVRDTRVTAQLELELTGNLKSEIVARLKPLGTPPE